MGSACIRVGAGGPSDTDRSVGSSSAGDVAACAAATGGGRVFGGAGASDDGGDFATAIQIRWTILRVRTTPCPYLLCLQRGRPGPLKMEMSVQRPDELQTSFHSSPRMVLT